MTSPRLAGKVIVILGGTAGIGLSAARALQAEGARLVVVGRPDAEAGQAQQVLGSEARVLTGDAADSGIAPAAIELARRDLGGFHGLYHVAGGSGRAQGDGPLHELTDAGWAATFQLNLTSVMLSNRAAVRQFLAQGGGGSILNVASVLAFSPSPAFFATHAYATAKAGILGLTRAAAAHYAAAGIRVNALAPGLVATAMSARAQADPAILRFLATKQPLAGGRLGQAADLDGAAVFFFSDESRFVTGQVLALDGGWSVSEGQIPSEP